MSEALNELTREEVLQHNKDGDLWVIIDAKVYNLSRFANLHPGGRAVLVDGEVAGQDATEAFYGLHRHEVLERPQYARLQIGIIRGEKSVITGRIVGGLSGVPYAEPTYLTKGFHSPYYTENHKAFQKVVRKFFDEVVYPDAQERELDGKRPSQEVFDKMAEVNLHAMRLGPGKHLKGLSLFHGLVKPEEFDYFHELIITQEMIRTGARGYADGLLGGKVIGLPPVLNFGSPEMKAKIVPEVLAAKKFICLAISEAHAGSDVLGMKTTAVKTEDGKYWIINGEKKWITNGHFADYFTTGCKTENGLTVILIPRQEGVNTKLIKTSYSSAAGTAFVTFDNVRVPVENTLGPDGGGIFVILSNFNHERWVMIAASARAQRMIVEECLKWVSQRKAFGKPLSSLAVIRAKLAEMIARAEAVQSWLENVTYQMCNMAYKEQAIKLAGQIAFLKMYSTQCAQDTARDAVQIFGGRGITQTGMGRFIEHYHRTIPFDAILGGAEDVLGDLGVRQAMRSMPKNARL
ncbi:peroxisomal acyl-CoA-dehydrogenase [Multifurca ochricompacta]|uniref:Peroxisomal acyl-CoA-dehydrogenase n=1 Tax=Multifurca ochricompacta TaxID=376703 RepID=A0AAD4M6V7_9AGAM|nr:peroxisomal acyl-CoA-dehydrogenase [Multifurca ochricompacta]